MNIKKNNKSTRQLIMKLNGYGEINKLYKEQFAFGEEGRIIRRQHHGSRCPICQTVMNYYTPPFDLKHPTIDHKNPQWLHTNDALNLQNFWVICLGCNKEKSGMTWTAYEIWLLHKYGEQSHQYQAALANRPSKPDN